MRLLIAILLLSLGSSAPAGALSRMENNLLAGLNGLLTAPADPIASAVSPPEEFRELPGGVVLAPVLGLCSGALMAVYRAGMGAVDIILAPTFSARTVSPEPRFPMFEGHVEYE